MKKYWLVNTENLKSGTGITNLLTKGREGLTNVGDYFSQAFKPTLRSPKETIDMAELIKETGPLTQREKYIAGAIAIKIPGEKNSFTVEEISSACKKLNIVCIKQKNIVSAKNLFRNMFSITHKVPKSCKNNKNSDNSL